MKRFRFKKIDAFAAGLSSGNPAACVYLKDFGDITGDEMQRIARELKGFVSEVVYLFDTGEGILLKYYSSECQVDFCGHGTVAAMHDFVTNSPALLAREEIDISVKGERLAVMNRINSEGSVYIHAPAPQFPAIEVSPQDAAAALGADDASVEDRFPVRAVQCGLTTLIVPVRGLDRCLSLLPPQEPLRRFCLDRGIDIVLAFTGETSRPGTAWRTRVFAPKFGYLEDPATGSGNSAFGHYLLGLSRWDGDSITIEQGPDWNDPNLVRLRTDAGTGDDRHVIFGGGAVVRIEGEYVL
ncbi:MAG: PhzF family phenazine biosynthesis protein [Spirochaetes bacterium]|nr:PhzF family phenazine biosynthesis protein [Spirochaetota bacterium]